MPKTLVKIAGLNVGEKEEDVTLVDPLDIAAETVGRIVQPRWLPLFTVVTIRVYLAKEKVGVNDIFGGSFSMTYHFKQHLNKL